MIKGIIFDFAGVIGTDGWWIWLDKKVKNLDSKRQYLFEISGQVDKSEITAEKFQELNSELTNIPAEKVWEEVKEEIIINKQIIKLIISLKKNYKIGLLTNFVSEWMHELLTNNNLWQYFDAIVISAEVKAVKPEPEAFQISLKRLELHKSEVIFIDDRQLNIEGGKVFGIDSILFKNVEDLKQELIKRGITI